MYLVDILYMMTNMSALCLLIHSELWLYIVLTRPVDSLSICLHSFGSNLSTLLIFTKKIYQPEVQALGYSFQIETAKTLGNDFPPSLFVVWEKDRK